MTVTAEIDGDLLFISVGERGVAINLPTESEMVSRVSHLLIKQIAGVSMADVAVAVAEAHFNQVMVYLNDNWQATRAPPHRPRRKKMPLIWCPSSPASPKQVLIIADRIEGELDVANQHLHLCAAYCSIFPSDRSLSGDGTERGPTDGFARMEKLLDHEAYFEAALTLVDDEWLWVINNSSDDGKPITNLYLASVFSKIRDVGGEGATPALALAAACLRARASVDRSGEAGETRSEAKGLDPKDDSAVGAEGAETPNPPSRSNP